MGNTVKVGIFMTVALVVLGWLIIRTEDLRLFRPEGKRIQAVFPSVAGLDDKSAVRVAGVRVGRVDGIALDGGRAVVSLLLDEDLGLTEGTWAEIANLGLLGDKYVNLKPGPEQAAPLPEGATIPGQPPASIDEVMASIGKLSNSLSQVAGQISGEAEATSPLARLIVNLELTSAEIRDLVAANRGQMDATIDNFETLSGTLARELPRLSSQLEGLLGEVRMVVAENRETLRGSLGNVERITEDVQTGVKNLNTISDRLVRGEGTIGKLLASDQAHDELVATLESVQSGVEGLTDTLGRIRKLQLQMSLESFYIADLEESRGSLTLDLDPQSGKRYRLGVVDDPRGDVSTSTQTITVTEADGSTSTRTIETVSRDDELTYTAMLGLPAGERFRLWAGMIESSGGAQIDWYPTADTGRYWLSAEAFDFDRPGDLEPHLRLTGGWKPHEYLYFVGGVDDLLTDEYRSLFLGAGLRWRDDDLKYLLGNLPSF